MGDLTLTNLAEDIYVAADTVGREVVGFIPSVTMNASSVQASVGDTVKAAVTAEATALVDIAGGLMSVPEAPATGISSDSFQLTNSKAVQIPLGAEQELQLQNAGQYATVYGDLIQQAMRKLTNAMEADLFTEIKNNAGAASGVQGTSPFAVGSNESGVEEILKAREILVDAGTPMDDVSCVMNTTAGANIRSNLKLLDASFAGNATLREQGTLIPIAGISLRESGQISKHVAGTAAATGLIKVADNVGSTSILIDSLDDGGTIKAGDVLESDAQEAAGTKKAFGVVSADLTAGSGGSGANELTATLNSGLVTATANDEEVRFLDYTGNFVFHRRAAELAMRAPAAPAGGDAATDAIVVQDPHSGLVFEVRVYKGYRKSMIEVAATWGVKAWKSDFIHTILG